MCVTAYYSLQGFTVIPRCLRRHLHRLQPIVIQTRIGDTVPNRKVINVHLRLGLHEQQLNLYTTIWVILERVKFDFCDQTCTTEIPYRWGRIILRYITLRESSQIEIIKLFLQTRVKVFCEISCSFRWSGSMPIHMSICKIIMLLTCPKLELGEKIIRCMAEQCLVDDCGC